jgi:integrase
MGGIYKRGKIYWLTYRRNGQKFFESSRSTKHEDAVNQLKLKEGEIVKGVPITPAIGRLKYEEAITDLLADHTLKGQETKKLKGRIELHLTPVFKCRRMSDLTRADFVAYAKKRVDEGAANATVNRELSWLRRAFNVARQGGKLLHVPTFPHLVEPPPVMEFYTREQLTMMLANLPTHLQTPVHLAYLTGWRKGEILDLQWRHVDFKAGELRLDPGSTKNGEARVIEFTPEMLTLLEAHKKRIPKGTFSPWVFTQPNGKRVRDWTLRRPWKAACIAAGIKGPRKYHSFRRTGARNMVRAGIPERVAMDMLGHKTRSIFDRYNITSRADLKDAAKKLADFDPAPVTTGVTNAAQLVTK